MRVRRVYKLLGLAGLLLLLTDSAQRWVYVHRAPLLAPRFSQGSSGPLTQAVFVAGQGMDEAETATSLRDLSAASAAVRRLGTTAERMVIRNIEPGGVDFKTETALQAISSSDCDHLVVFLTGHGGGLNFGAVGGMNITRYAFAGALSRARFRKATVMVDCCWSGEFGRSLSSRSFSGPVTLITSTDAEHPSPYPISFLSPRSFGRMFFDRWDGNAQSAFAETNESRRSLRWLYSDEFGLEGQLRVFEAPR